MPFRFRMHSGRARVTALSWRLFVHRFSLVLFLALAGSFLVVGHFRPVALKDARLYVMDGLSPLMDVFSRPAANFDEAVRRVTAYLNLRSENERLHEQVQRLERWQTLAAVATHENKELRTLLRYVPEPRATYISGRVIADTGGPFVRTLIMTAGARDGARQDMAAMTGDGLVGRVVEVGNNVSRILLLTDLNSRIPVMIAESNDHAILAGDNTGHPKLLYLPPDSSLKPGDHVLTSGHGGVFPPSLPVGIVTRADSSGVYDVQPLAELGRVNQLRLIDFTPTGGALNGDALTGDALSHKAPPPLRVRAASPSGTKTSSGRVDTP